MNFRQKTNRIFTAALVVWMSGVVVLFCCGNMPVKAAKTESCPLAKKGHCARTAEQSLTESFGQPPSSFDCCAFPAKIFDKVRKIEKSPESAVGTKIVQIAAPRFFSITKFSDSAVFYQSFNRNRSGTYLRNCLFRI